MSGDRERVDGCLEKIGALIKERDAWQTIAKNLTELLDEAEAQYAELSERIAAAILDRCGSCGGLSAAAGGCFASEALKIVREFIPTTIPDQETPAP